eukprot:TRINITY_DN2926_c0_g1_i2.p1 TRINITY_DN2926_c0_g1~~TRINITY_DN2926_c0_g1_i2.p1  ORF type:complete len:307 (-),score=82.14 TRINITY_DN2926_c0_g1_i2:421-1341(-)
MYQGLPPPRTAQQKQKQQQQKKFKSEPEPNLSFKMQNHVHQQHNLQPPHALSHQNMQSGTSPRSDIEKIWSPPDKTWNPDYDRELERNSTFFMMMGEELVAPPDYLYQEPLEDYHGTSSIYPQPDTFGASAPYMLPRIEHSAPHNNPIQRQNDIDPMILPSQQQRDLVDDILRRSDHAQSADNMMAPPRRILEGHRRSASDSAAMMSSHRHDHLHHHHHHHHSHIHVQQANNHVSMSHLTPDDYSRPGVNDYIPSFSSIDPSSIESQNAMNLPPPGSLASIPRLDSGSNMVLVESPSPSPRGGQNL